MTRWMRQSLSRKVLVSVAAVLGIASVVFLGVFVGLYRSELADERSAASERINQLLQATLENAMIKRDIDGLQAVVNRLGTLEDIRSVMIVNPEREIRFASDPNALGRTMTEEPLEAHTRFVTLADGGEVLRSVNPVANKPVCTQCHGAIEDHPVNGVLFVDYDADALRDKALSTALTLGGAGVAVLILTLATLYLILRRMVLSPIERVERASAKLAEGDLDVRVPVHARDEIGSLARGFNTMAASLETSMAEVRRRDEFLQALIDGIPDGVRVIDPETFEIIACNRAYAGQIGATGAEDVIGRPCHLSSHRRGEPCPPTLVTCPIHEMKRRKEPVKAVHQHIGADGRPFYVEVTAAPLRAAGPDGRRRTLIVESIRDMRADIDVSHGQRLSEMAQLATGVAHEIRNPLVAIRMALEGILRKGSDALTVEPVRLERYLAVMKDQVDQCVGVSERLLDLAHVPTEGAVPVDVAAALADAEALLGYEARVCAVDMTVTMPPAGTQVLATGPELRMLAVNLMQNAFHAMPGGGTLAVAAVVEHGRMRLSIADTGVGIAADALPRIFDPYFSSRADGMEGTGMGLTICKDIVETYGGRISVESVQGVGTTFTVDLPLHDPARISAQT